MQFVCLLCNETQPMQSLSLSKYLILTLSYSYFLNLMVRIVYKCLRKSNHLGRFDIKLSFQISCFVGGSICPLFKAIQLTLEECESCQNGGGDAQQTQCDLGSQVCSFLLLLGSLLFYERSVELEEC